MRSHYWKEEDGGKQSDRCVFQGLQRRGDEAVEPTAPAPQALRRHRGAPSLPCGNQTNESQTEALREARSSHKDSGNACPGSFRKTGDSCNLERSRALGPELGCEGHLGAICPSSSRSKERQALQVVLLNPEPTPFHRTTWWRVTRWQEGLYFSALHFLVRRMELVTVPTSRLPASVK